jgi:Putative DNA-binding domain
MRALAEMQRQLRNAIIAADADESVPPLIGGCNPRERLAIHRRHYEVSLVTALMNRFPATVWLMGSDFVAQAARSFVHRRPPSVPCIAEYGVDFPDYLATCAGAGRAPFLSAFAALEWHLGRISVEIAAKPIDMEAFAGVAAEQLPDVRPRLQGGLQYMQAAWPVDDLMTLYLTDRQPETYAMAPCEMRLEIRGARGEFHMTRLDHAAFAFRSAIIEGHAIIAAAEFATQAEPDFDVGQALCSLVADGLVVAIDFADEGVVA